MVLTQKDYMNMRDDYELKVYFENAMKSGPKGTRIIMSDHDTGEVFGDLHNKIIMPGSQWTACRQFGLEYEVNFPTYNQEFQLENTLDYEVEQPYNEPIICLFCIGQGGCGTAVSDVYKVRVTERIEPKDMLPFRYVDEEHDLNDDMRKVYFGRYTDENGMIRYMFKAFDTEPQLHLRYLDGTQLTSSMFAIDSSQGAECYVETRLRITRMDFRDYFEQVTGWNNAIINTLSLLYGWYDNTKDQYLWYQEVLPFSKLNFPTEWLVDLSKAIDINYQVFY